MLLLVDFASLFLALKTQKKVVWIKYHLDNFFSPASELQSICGDLYHLLCQLNLLIDCVDLASDNGRHIYFVVLMLELTTW